ncbi:MAG TPA: UBP-type zinc finger domain-containing protein [Candidatus Binatia bacterium]|nr:UBP-type zinc finger domain-containing protein [Candidatus Binatia bacterium]
MADVPAASTECGDCVAMGASWVHLRQCLVCGKTGCCDNSVNRHATGHSRETGHALIQSAQPGEKWAWCYPDNAFFIPGEDGGWALFED